MGGMVQSGAAWILSLQRFGIRPGLERTRRVLALLGNPDAGIKFYHVAGTNGKGSVCAFLAEILGVRHRVGVFTSPAFDGYRARFRVNDALISDETFDRMALVVQKAVQVATPDDPLTEFEALTVMAILYFAEEKVSHVVWETGLGGRYDSTNVVSPAVTAITNVGLDHTEILGDTIALIARDKSGIIKPGVPIVTGARDEAYIVIEGTAQRYDAPLWTYGSTFGAAATEISTKGQVIAYRGKNRDLYQLPVPLFGRHQVDNAAIALAMWEVGVENGHSLNLSRTELVSALSKVRWPLRFEVLTQELSIPVILDGAHNPAGARVFKQSLQDYARAANWTCDGFVMVVGVLADKDAVGMLRQLLSLAKAVFVASPASARALPPDELANLVWQVRNDVAVTTVSTIGEAVREAYHYALIHEVPLCCFGSLYTVDEARKAILVGLSN